MIAKLLIVIVVVLLAGFALRTYMPKLGSSVAGGFEQRDGENRLRDCPDMPNCQGTESSRATQQVERVAINNDADKAMEKIVSIVSAQTGAELVSRDDSYAHFTFTSAVLQFVDDVEFLVSDDRQSVQIRSASRLGKSDLGANEKRINELNTVLTGEL